MIEELWVIHAQGACLFHRKIENHEIKKNVNSDEQLFGGFVSAIFQFHSKVTSEIIEKMESNMSKFMFFIYGDLFFVVKAEVGIADKKIKKKIDFLKERFVFKFSEELNEIKNIGSFQKFEEDLDQIFLKLSKAEKWGNNLTNLSL